jgi:hypothetical protein
MKGANPFMLWANNSFINGRKTELAEFKSYLNAIVSGQSQGIMITGIPGIGKSTLLRHFRDDTEKAKMLAVYVKAGKGERMMSFAGKLAHESVSMIAGMAPELTGRELLPKLKTLGEITDGIERAIKGKQEGVLFFFDDVDLLKEQRELAGKVSQLLAKKRRVGVILAGTNSIDPLPEKTRIMKLGSFEEHDVQEFVKEALKKGPPDMGDACMKTILTDSEGNPRIVATMCRVIYDRMKENEKRITRGHYLAFFPAIMSMLAGEFFSPLYESIPEAERVVLAAFAKEGRTMHISDIAKRVRKRLGVVTTLAMRLVKRGALVRVERGQYRVFTKLFGRYVIERTSFSARSLRG